ncbi:hypothetical protein ANRL1_01532 [Anaerolineae bacterium]|nr:hypothetical protein ANRL1_01532 [Anaerolineae bacterium]
MEEHLELFIAFFACAILAVFYAIYALLLTPSGGNPFGHFIGIVGMALMLVTETIYTLRKRIRWLNWLGPLRLWLSFHIFTGIVGPFLVLLHSAFMVGGLAGFAMLMTGIVVLSGFAGRYIYTAVPRTRAGVEVNRDDLAARAAQLQNELNVWAAQKPALINALNARVAASPVNPNDWLGFFTRAWQDYAYDQQVHSALHGLEHSERARFGELEKLLRRRRQLERQIASLSLVHRLMSVWRLVHVPLGAALFTAAFIHVIAALFFKGFRL